MTLVVTLLTQKGNATYKKHYKAKNPEIILKTVAVNIFIHYGNKRKK